MAPPDPSSGAPPKASFGVSPLLLGSVAAFVLLVPGLLPHVLSPAVLDEEFSRVPLLYLALAALTLVAPARPSRGLGRASGLLFLLALASGLPVVFPTEREALARPDLTLALAMAVAFGAGTSEGARGARRLTVALASTGAVGAAWVLLDRTAGRPPVGPFGRPGVAGPALAALLPLAFALEKRAVAWSIAVLAAAAICATQSRTAGFAAGAGLFVALALPLRGRSARVTWLLGGAAAAAGVAILVLSTSGALPGGSWIGRTDTVRVRTGLAKASVALIAERPVAGHGHGGFAAEVLRVRDPDEALASFGRRPFAAHDDYLHFAVEGGIPAALALIALVACAVAFSVRRARRASPDDAPPVAAAAGSLVAIGIAALAEDPFLAAPTVLVFGLLAGIGAGGGTSRPTVPPRLFRFAAFVALSIAAVHAGDRYVAESRIAAYVDAVSRAHGDPKSTEEAYRILDEADAVSFFGSPPPPRVLFLKGVHLAQIGRYRDAREAYGRLLELDPGATEGRLDSAETSRLEGHAVGARGVLESARKHDPTRFDVPLRLGHLLLDEERPPSMRAPPADPIAILRLYDEAIALAPYRFEGRVALARFYRRTGDLPRAGAELRAANAMAPKAAEILLEAFRLAEAEKRSDYALVGILGVALASDPTKAGEIRREAARCLDAGAAGEATALAKAAKDLAPPDFAAVNSDYAAAVVRFAGLVQAGLLDAAVLRREAEAEARAGRHRSALARYRALLADPYAAADPDLAFAAASSASRVDGALAESLKSQGRVLLGYEALEKKDVEAALKHFRTARDKDAGSVQAHYGLAKALARAGKSEEAAASLRTAIDLDPSAGEHAAQDPDLSAIAVRVKAER